MSNPGGQTPLDKNRALAEWLEYQLRQVKQRIRELEVQEQRDRRRLELARAGLRWKVQPTRSSSAALVHRGDCALYPAGGEYISREEALAALADADIEACPVCRPDTGLTQG